MKLLNRRARAARRGLGDRAIPSEHTTMDAHGAVRSIQAADLTMPDGELDEIWTPMHLERLARTYWKYLSRVTLGLIRVALHRRPSARSCCSRRPFVLLRFHAPEYEMDARARDRALAIRDGILVARAGRDGRRLPRDRRPALPGRRRPGYEQVHVEVEVANFYPALAHLGRALVLRQHAVAHPRARHARLPALARAAGARGVGRRALRRAGTPAHAGAPHAGERARRRRRRARDASATRRGRVVGALAGACAVPALRRCAARRRRLGASRRRSRSARAASRGRGATGSAAPCPSAMRITSDSVRRARAALVADALRARRRRSRRWRRRSTLSPLTRSSWVSTRSRS